MYFLKCTHEWVNYLASMGKQASSYPFDLLLHTHLITSGYLFHVMKGVAPCITPCIMSLRPSPRDAPIGDKPTLALSPHFHDVYILHDASILFLSSLAQPM